jgi:hypothetical protein
MEVFGREAKLTETVVPRGVPRYGIENMIFDSGSRSSKMILSSSIEKGASAAENCFEVQLRPGSAGT